ncbi:MAG: NAD(+)/NADH kinase [Clostridia bacterium]|nr:NAD(+)/NADH kinase [Clostridia bacterium]
MMKKLFVHPNPTKDGMKEVVAEILPQLFDLGFEVFMDRDGECLPDDLRGVELLSFDDALRQCQCALVIGGDGTILRIAVPASLAGKPVLGINKGTLGFIPELEVSEIGLMKALHSGDFHYDHRMMLDISVESADGELIFHGTALNDASVIKGTLSKMIDICVKANGKKTIAFKGDGVIVCTPTGSTAYSLSAGGPILEPSCSCMAVTPICPHSINIKSFVLPAEHDIEVKINPGSNAAFILADGSAPVQLSVGDKIRIKKSDLSLDLIRIKDPGFYEVIRKKLSKESS